MRERYRILKEEVDKLVAHYTQPSDWDAIETESWKD